ncbi:uncharacterized protein FYW47_017466 [Aplochiton taeniatus]
MSVRHQNLLRQAEAFCEEGPGDADSYSDGASNSSGRSSQSRSRSSGEYSTKNKGGQKNLKPKKSHPWKGKTPISPRVRPLEGLQQRICSAHVQRIKQLGSQAWELQRQLSGATTENKLLRQVQNRHTVALQHIQESQDGLPQLLLKHNNEVHAMQELLRKARLRRNSLARRLQATEGELLRTKDALHHLQLLSEDRSLMEREELAGRLAEASTDLDKKNKRIQYLERNLELSNTSFNRQITTEARKTNEARELSGYLEAQIDQLTQKIKDRERQLDINNIYSHRYPKGCNGKDRSEQDGYLGKEDPQPQIEEGIPEEVADNGRTSEGEQTEMLDHQFNPEDFLNLARLHSKDKSPRIKRHYTFKETIQNLHRGKPAYSSHTLRSSPPRYLRSQVQAADLGSGSYQPSFVTLPAGRGLRCDEPFSEEGAVHRKKSDLMKELFGQTQMVAVTTGKARTKESNVDKLSCHQTGDSSLISSGRKAKITFD